MTARQARITVIAMDAIMALNCVGGAWYALGGAPGVPLEWLDGTPFDDYTIPGLILGVVVGGSQLAAAIVVALRRPAARRVQLAASVILMGWIATQVAMIGYVSLLQPIVFCWGIWTLSLTRRVGPHESSGRDGGAGLRRRWLRRLPA